MLKTLATAATVLASLAGSVAPAAASPAPPWPLTKMLIDVVSANGSGCPLGTADATVSRTRPGVGEVRSTNQVPSR